jgi:hypothetical protein
MPLSRGVHAEGQYGCALQYGDSQIQLHFTVTTANLTLLHSLLRLYRDRKIRKHLQNAKLVCCAAHLHKCFYFLISTLLLHTSGLAVWCLCLHCVVSIPPIKFLGLVWGLTNNLVYWLKCCWNHVGFRRGIWLLVHSVRVLRVIRISINWNNMPRLK